VKWCIRTSRRKVEDMAIILSELKPENFWVEPLGSVPSQGHWLEGLTVCQHLIGTDDGIKTLKKW